MLMRLGHYLIWSSVLLLLVISPCWATDYTQDANCQGAWLMDIDEDPITDSSQNSYTGALTAADNPDFSTTDPPAAYSVGYYDFDGNDRINCGDINEIEVANFTAVAWIKSDDTADDDDILVKGEHTTSQPFLLWRDNAVGGGQQQNNTNCLSTLFYDGDTQRWISTDSGTLNDTDWHHIAVTFTGNNATGLKLYIDGSLAQTGSSLGCNQIGATSQSLGIGAALTGTPPYMEGNIDEVAVFDRVLNLTEIQDIKDNGLTGVEEEAAVFGLGTTLRLAKLVDAVIYGSPPAAVPPVTDRLLLDDGTSHLLLDDGTSKLLIRP